MPLSILFSFIGRGNVSTLRQVTDVLPNMHTFIQWLEACALITFATEATIERRRSASDRARSPSNSNPRPST